MKGLNIFLADGFEDIEALAVCDVLRRSGLEVNLVSITDSLNVCSSHGVMVLSDKKWEDCNFTLNYLSERDVMIFPGGMPGARTLSNDASLISHLQAHYAQGGAVAAICAAPGLVLSQLNDIEGKYMTCFDGFETGIISAGGIFVRRAAVRDGRIVTGRSAGDAVEFGLTILKMVLGEYASKKVQDAMLLKVE